MDVIWIEDEAGLADLEATWRSLHGCLERPSIFLSHEWAQAAWAWRRRDSELRVAHVRDEGDTIGLAPLIVRRERHHGIDCRVLGFLTVPDAQYCNLLARPGRERDVASAVVDALARRSGDWDLLRLDRLPEDAIAPWRAAVAGAGIFASTGLAATNPRISLTGGWSAFYGRRSRRLKKGNNLIKNRLQRDYRNIEIEWLIGPDVSGSRWSAALDEVIRVSASSWKADTGLTLDKDGPGAFIRTLAARAAPGGWLSIWLLRLDGQVAAAEFQLVHDGDVHALRADFDKAFDEDSPGTFLNWQLLERLFASGKYRSYQMGPGDNSYKLRWAEEYEQLYMFEACGSSWRGRIIAGMKRYLRPLLRQLRRRKLNDVADMGEASRGK